MLENRWIGYKRYYALKHNIGEYDYFNNQMIGLSKMFSLDEEQRCWLSFLFSLSYSIPTTWILFFEFPYYNNFSIKKFSKFWLENKKKLIFSSDRTKVKNFDLPPKMVESYKRVMGANQIDTVQKSLVYGDKHSSYNKLYALCNEFYYFGRFSIDLYVETTTKLLGLDVELDKMNWNNKTNESIRNGLLYTLAMDEYVTQHHQKPKKELTKQDFALLDNSLKNLIKQIKNDFLTDSWIVCACLCSWKKMFWGVRYPGYYLDRQLEQLKQIEELNPDVSFLPIWELRKQTMDNKYLGELQGWSGIRKELLQDFMKTGKIIAKP